MGVNVSVIAVDAGNSKTDVALIGADGTVLAKARGAGFQPPLVGVEAALDVLGSVLDRAVAELPSATGSSGHLSACLANADLPVEEAELAEALEARTGCGGARSGALDVLDTVADQLRAGGGRATEGVTLVVCAAPGSTCAAWCRPAGTRRLHHGHRPGLRRAWGEQAGQLAGRPGVWFAAVRRGRQARLAERQELARKARATVDFGLDSMVR
ncbi:Kinase OS=Streptomyces microflavus OX=1919 GN=Smic_24810 PE=4 SV=1 [Streptomyces microflavus]